MKLVVLACMVALAVAAPRPDKDAVTLVDERSDDGDGSFIYKIETSNGIDEERTGTRGYEGQSNMSGTIRFTFPDGTVAVMTYVADKNGFRAESPLIPTPHPLPQHAIDQIAYANEQAKEQRALDVEIEE